MVIAMILAGGKGSRVGADRPKQFIEINGKPIVAYVIDIYQNHQEIDAIEVVCHKEWKAYLIQTIKKYRLTKVHWIADGGNLFQDSVINGMNVLQDDSEVDANSEILIHYGAAPFTSDLIVSDCIRVTKERASAFSATPCYQLIGTNDYMEADRDREPNRILTSNKWIDRDSLIQIACPQGFKLYYLENIYSRAKERNLLNCTEPHITSLVQALGDILYQSYGDQTNIKITTIEDVKFFEKWVLGSDIIAKKG